MNQFMNRALELAETGASQGEVPVGAVVVHNQTIIAEAYNLVETLKDPTAHAEMLALREAAKSFGRERLEACDLYVTLEPCTMCAGAISHARVRRLYYGAYDLKGGAVDHGVRFFHQGTCLHAPEVYGGIDENASQQLLKLFFADKR